MSLLPRENWFDLDHPFEHFFPSTNRLTKTTFAPKVDIIDKENIVEIRADLPGVDKEDIKVELHDGVLSLSATTQSEDSEEKDGKVIRQERFSGSYQRSFTVGNNIHESDIKANFDNGVLTITAPKMALDKPKAKQINIG